MDRAQLVVLTVIGARLLMPLSIIRWPLPAIVACLLIDAAGQTIFQVVPGADLSGDDRADAQRTSDPRASQQASSPRGRPVPSQGLIVVTHSDHPAALGGTGWGEGARLAEKAGYGTLRTHTRLLLQVR